VEGFIGFVGAGSETVDVEILLAGVLRVRGGELLENTRCGFCFILVR
jgi:hypothetical protein